MVRMAGSNRCQSSEGVGRILPAALNGPEMSPKVRAGLIVMAKVNDAVAPAASVAVYVTVTALSVGASGVPESVRVAGSNDSPAGRAERR